MAVEPKIFARFDLNALNQIAALPVETARFILTCLSRERNRYVYTGDRRLRLTGEDRQLLLSPKQSDYRHLTIDADRRRHWERLHGRKKDGKLWEGGKPAPFAPGAVFPAIRTYNRETGQTELLQPVSQYRHTPCTPDIDYAFNETFIDRQSRFKHGYRDVCVNALDRLRGRYARLFFIYLSGNMYEFHFGVTKLRALLDIENHYKRRSSIKLIFECVKKEFAKIELEFDYAWGTEEEWTAHKKSIDRPGEKQPEENPEDDAGGKKQKKKKGKVHIPNFWFRVKGMDRYRIPKGEQSMMSVDAGENRNCAAVYNFLLGELHMKKAAIQDRWKYIIRYIDEWGSDELIKFCRNKLIQMANQKKKPDSPRAVLLKLILQAVKDLEAEGRGRQRKVTSLPEPGHYDPEGKDTHEISLDLAAKFDVKRNLDSS